MVTFVTVAVILTVGGAGLAIVLPESSGVLPDWYAAPDITGESKLSTLAQELSMLLIPETLAADKFEAHRVASIQSALASAGVAADASLVTIDVAQDPAELRRKILPHASLAAEEKIVVAGGDVDVHLTEWRRQGLRVGFTNGCFDILHPGHVKVLTAARGACDRLIVGLNSDASVKRLKGEGRPVQDERERAEVLAALEAVDLVAIFEEDTPIDLITQVKPSVLVKGGDYTREQVVGYEVVEAGGGEVLLVDILEGHSTTSLVRRARESYP
jgi:D-beta-D-heptose 7-phosphate kinase/D-beta-D-heptose 1-phosphate adenosyltransferase